MKEICMSCHSSRHVNHIPSFHIVNLLCCRGHFSNIPPNICLDEDVLKTSWRPLSSSSSEDIFKTSLDVWIKTNIFALAIRLQKTSSRRLGQDRYIRLGHTSSRRLQDVFKTSCKNFFKRSSRSLQDVLQKRLQDIFKTSSRRLAKASSRYLRDVFKTFRRRLQDCLERYL